MTILRVIWLLMFVSFSVRAEDVLVPCEYSFHSSRIRGLIERGIDGKAVYSFSVVPGDGSPERGWLLYKSGERWVIRSVRFRTAVWGNDEWSLPREEGAGWIETQLKVRELEVHQELVELLAKAFRRALELRVPVPEGIYFSGGSTVEMSRNGECVQFFAVESGGRLASFWRALENLASAPWAITTWGNRRKIASSEELLMDFVQ